MDSKSFTHAVWFKTGFILLTNFIRVLLAVSQILFYFRLSSQITSDYGIHISEIQRRILLDDFLGSRAFLKCAHYRVERDTRPTDSNNSIGIAYQRNLFNCRYHLYTLSATTINDVPIGRFTRVTSAASMRPTPRKIVLSQGTVGSIST